MLEGPKDSVSTNRDTPDTVATSAGDALRDEATSVDSSDKTARSGETDKTNSEEVKVLTFNIAVDGIYGLPGVIELIRSAKADVVGLQEAGDNTAKIAQSLGYNYVKSGGSAILTRLKIDSITPEGNGVVLRTDSGKQFAFFDEHLNYKPYQPYQLLGIPYENSPFVNTEPEAIAEAKRARQADVERARKDIASLPDSMLPTIVVGDFNEPSFLDWTDAAAAKGRIPIKVEWPATKAMADDGFRDSYRQLHPDEIANPGYTWTPLTKIGDPTDHHDRIDFILYRGEGITAKSSQIIGENKEDADIVFTPFPSDHRAVTTTFELKNKPK